MTYFCSDLISLSSHFISSHLLSWLGLAGLGLGLALAFIHFKILVIIIKKNPFPLSSLSLLPDQLSLLGSMDASFSSVYAVGHDVYLRA